MNFKNNNKALNEIISNEIRAFKKKQIQWSTGEKSKDKPGSITITFPKKKVCQKYIKERLRMHIEHTINPHCQNFHHCFNFRMIMILWRKNWVHAVRLKIESTMRGVKKPNETSGLDWRGYNLGKYCISYQHSMMGILKSYLGLFWWWHFWINLAIMV